MHLPDGHFVRIPLGVIWRQQLSRRCISLYKRIPTVKLKIPGFFLKSNPELLLHSLYSLFYFSHFSWLRTCCNWQIAKVKNYNLNVTEVLDSTLKIVFPEFSISPSGSYPEQFTNQRDMKTVKMSGWNIRSTWGS